MTFGSAGQFSWHWAIILARSQEEHGEVDIEGAIVSIDWM